MAAFRRSVGGLLLVVASAAVAAALFAGPSAAGAAPRGWSLPPGAKQISDDVWEIGSKNVDGETITGLAILHHGHGARGGSKGPGGGGSKAYAFIGNGFKWKTFG